MCQEIELLEVNLKIPAHYFAKHDVAVAGAGKSTAAKKQLLSLPVYVEMSAVPRRRTRRHGTFFPREQREPHGKDPI